ncbi:MAG: tail protein X [Roseibium sp.]
MPETIKIAGDNLTFDLILWRRYGLPGLRLVEETMALNPLFIGPYLPLGAEIVIPDLPVQQAYQREVVTLFG